jgi:hypothetical protein
MGPDGATARHSSRDIEKGKYKRTHSRFGLIAVLLPWQQLVTPDINPKRTST